MSDLDATTPRVFLARHGETEWTISGQHTGRSDIPMTAFGERQVRSTGALLVGPGKLLDPRSVKKVFVSPRQRATRTYELLFSGIENAKSGGQVDVAGINEEIFGGGKGSVEVTEEIAEWDYGEYDGLLAADVRKIRREQGLDRAGVDWNVWRDGCVGGESKIDVEMRLDRLIQDIHNLQEPHMKGASVADVLVVAHGLIGRCFVKRWLRMPVDADLPMMLPPGGIAMLSYNNHDINKPAFFVGMALPPC